MLKVIALATAAAMFGCSPVLGESSFPSGSVTSPNTGHLGSTLPNTLTRDQLPPSRPATLGQPNYNGSGQSYVSGCPDVCVAPSWAQPTVGRQTFASKAARQRNAARVQNARMDDRV